MMEVVRKKIGSGDDESGGGDRAVGVSVLVVIKS